MMFSISWTMTLISLFILPITAVIVKIVVGKSQKYFASQQEYLGHVNRSSRRNIWRTYNCKSI